MIRRRIAILAALFTGACVGGEPAGGPIETRTSALVTHLTGVTQIAVGHIHVCARLESGRVACWGTGVNGNSAEPIDVPGLGTVESIATGNGFTCAVRSDKRVVCWGIDNNGTGEPWSVLGDGITQSATPVAIALPGPAGALAVSAGEHTACALRSDRTVNCWGRGVDGQLGDGAFADSSAPVTVSGLSDAVAIAVGELHACALRADHSVVCWGDGSRGKLGTGDTDASGEPVAVADISDALSIAAGEDHTCVVRANHEISCWGMGVWGQIGNGIYADALVPTTVSGIADAVSVAGGGEHTCAVHANQQVSCWGNNDGGQLGDGTHEPSALPLDVSGSFSAVSAGGFNTCAIRNQQEAACWGHGIHGELGNGTFDRSMVPVAVFGGRALGQGCADDTTCDSGHCVDGVCCFTTCGGGALDDCEACSKIMGASLNGECTARLPGPCADDGNPCTADFCDGMLSACQHPAGNDGEVCASAACEVATCSGASSVCPDLAAIPECTFESTGGGTNVAVEVNGGLDTVGGALIIFSQVSDGDVTLTANTVGGPPPDEYGLVPDGLARYFDIDTTATYPPNGAADIVVCLHYDQDWLPDLDHDGHGDECHAPARVEQECALQLVHYDAAGVPTALPPPPAWMGLDPLEPIGNTICGLTHSLSPFALAVPLDRTPPLFVDLPGTITAFATSTQGANVSYPTPNAVDALDGPRPVSCAPASGFQFPPGKTTVTCTAADAHGNPAGATFTVWVQYQAPSDGTFFLQPINPDNTSIFKKGSTVPVKFRLHGASAGISNLVARLSVAKVSNGIEGTSVEAVSTSAADAGNMFRSDGSGGQYIFNLSTKSLATGTWSLHTDLGDEVTHQVDVSLR